MIIDILTIFPEFFEPFLNTSIIKRAIEQKSVEIVAHQLRDYSHNKHKKVDDTPYGGGVGMLMQFPPFYDAIHDLKKHKHAKVIMLSPQGRLFDQQIATELSAYDQLILLCGHYEGIDARVESIIDEEISIGNYILTGGEIPAMILTDAVTRLVSGVIQEASQIEDSLQNGWLKHPQYTKPDHYKGYVVPDVLKSGHHQDILTWRKKERIKNTMLKRPDLFEKIQMTDEELKIFEVIKKEMK